MKFEYDTKGLKMGGLCRSLGDSLAFIHSYAGGWGESPRTPRMRFSIPRVMKRGLAGADPHHIPVESRHGQNKRVRRITKRLLFQNTKRDLLTHA